MNKRKNQMHRAHTGKKYAKYQQHKISFLTVTVTANVTIAPLFIL
jgi:hypothetical protein